MKEKIKKIEDIRGIKNVKEMETRSRKCNG